MAIGPAKRTPAELSKFSQNSEDQQQMVSVKPYSTMVGDKAARVDQQHNMCEDLLVGCRTSRRGYIMKAKEPKKAINGRIQA